MLHLNGTRHVVWDWNGTLLDDAWLIRDSLNALLAQRGLPTLSPEEHASGFGFPLKAYYTSVGFDFERESFEGVSHQFKEHYEARRQSVALRSGAVELLREFHARGLQQSLLSAYNQDLLRNFVADRELGQWFQTVTGTSNHTAEGKIELGRGWLAESALDPASVLMIGDTLHDVEVAQAMGVRIVLIASGHQSRERLEASGFPVFDTFDAMFKPDGNDSSRS
ncbi:MAG: HAD family hydrolase [Candidatus Cloacimonetes bacterium]|nr:HAD family hydrolase [Candidatus Cloacimonadota bacterium]